MLRVHQNSTIWNAVFAVLVLCAVKAILDKFNAFRRALYAARQYPGGEILWVQPFRALAVLLSPIYPARGKIGSLLGDFSVYKKYGSTGLSSLVFWSLTPVFYISDADAIRTIAFDRQTFPKDAEAYEGLNIYGPNLVGTEGADWKRHRAVARPAFNEANNGLVWSESIRIINEWFNQLDISNGPSDFTVDTVPTLTQVTLLVISAAGFGRRWLWTSEFQDASPGYRYSFPAALHAALDGLLPLVLTPTWCLKLSQTIHLPFLSQYLGNTLTGFRELKLYIIELVSVARAWASGDKTSHIDAALLKNLVEANMTTQEGSSKNLTDDELISNVFTFLLAGHETSCHSLCFAIVLLALYPDVQRKLYEEVTDVWPDGVPITSAVSTYKEDFPKLQYTWAVFHETLRCFPPVPQLAKPVKSDAVLKIKRFTHQPAGSNIIGDLEEVEMKLPAQSIVVVDILGTQMSPLYWGEDVEEFKPERFIDTDTYRWPRDAFLAFSAGPRSCIGQRFALTESVCILAAIVRRYEILVPSDLQSLSLEEKKRQMLKWLQRVTMTPTNARVRFRRRS